MGTRRANPTDADKTSASLARVEIAQPSSVPVVGTAEQELTELFAKREAAKVYQLALWPETQRAMPTEFIRSALFAAIQPDAAICVARGGHTDREIFALERPFVES